MRRAASYGMISLCFRKSIKRFVYTYLQTSPKGNFSFVVFCLIYHQIETLSYLGILTEFASRVTGRGTSFIDHSARFPQEILNECGLMDIAKFQTCSGVLVFTHFQVSSHARLDRICTTFYRTVTRYFVKPGLFSVHCVVGVDIGWPRTKVSNVVWEPWKINSKLLADEKFNATGNKHLSELLEGSMSCIERWGRFKEGIKINAIEGSSEI